MYSGIKRHEISPEREMLAVFAGVCFLSVVRVSFAVDLPAVNCSQVKDAYTSLGFSPTDVPNAETAGKRHTSNSHLSYNVLHKIVHTRGRCHDV